MERPGFNPQALALKLGSQRSGANKEKKQAARRVRRRLGAGGNNRINGDACDGHGSIRLLGDVYSTFLRFVQDADLVRRISNVRWQFRKRIVRRHSKPAKFTYVARQSRRYISRYPDPDRVLSRGSWLSRPGARLPARTARGAHQALVPSASLRATLPRIR
jgi:hypothetical protein